MYDIGRHRGEHDKIHIRADDHIGVCTVSRRRIAEQNHVCLYADVRWGLKRA